MSVLSKINPNFGKFACQKCDIQYASMQNLKNHIQFQHEGVKFSCQDCSKQFAVKSQLYNHIKIVHEGALFDCNKCSQQYTE